MTENIHVYVDMDGVLAVWDPTNTVDDTFQPGYFLSRELEPTVAQLIHKLEAAGIKVTILTSVYTNGIAEKEKAEWLRNNGIYAPAIKVPYGESKQKYVESGELNILLDDYSKNLTEWANSGYVGIKFFNGINGSNGTWTGYAVHKNQDADTLFKTILAIASIEGEK